MDEKMIAPCGMNCSLCIAYQSGLKDLKKRGINRKTCPGCVPRGEHCTHMAHTCDKVGKGTVRFCFECEDYPCKRLKALDKRYRTKYHMSMIANLDSIRQNGMQKFLESQEAQWKCPACGDTLCCHVGLCLGCSLEVLLANRKYRWNREENRDGEEE